MRPPQVALFAMLALVVGGFAIRYSSLPPVVASHFGPDGQPNGWMSRSGFALFSVIPLGAVVIVAIVAPMLVAKLPVSMVNLPNKEYWLAPERKEESVRRFRGWMEWFGVALLVFVTFVYDLVFRANAAGEGLANGPFLAGLVAFLLFTVGWSVALYRAFPPP